MGDAALGEQPGEEPGAEIGPVVGHHRVHRHVVRPEPVLGSGPELDQGSGSLVVEGLDVGDPGVVVDGYVQIGVPAAAAGTSGASGAAGATGLGALAAVCSPAPARGDLRDFLDVEMHQLPRRRSLIAADHPPSRAVDDVQPVQPVAAKDPPHCRSRHPGARRQIHRAPLRAAPQPADPLLGAGVGAPRRPARQRAAVRQPAIAVLEPAAPPLRDRARDSFIWRATSAWGSPAATRWTSSSRPAGVKRALACDIEPPVLVGCYTTTLAQGARPIALLPTSMPRTSRPASRLRPQVSRRSIRARSSIRS